MTFFSTGSVLRLDVLTFCCVVLKEIYSTTRSSGTSREKKDGVMLGVCFSRLLCRSHSDGLSWIDGASAGSNMRREDKRTEEGGGGRRRRRYERNGRRKKKEIERKQGLRYTTFSAAGSREEELLTSGSMLSIQLDSTFAIHNLGSIDLSRNEIQFGISKRRIAVIVYYLPIPSFRIHCGELSSQPAVDPVRREA